jgi:acyl-CoA hydrolase
MPKKQSASGKPVAASQTEMTQMVLPNDANPLGNILGGTVMHLVDIAGAIAAHRHSSSYVVTASIDHMDFRSPIRVGEVIILKASVNRAFWSSMEVGVKVFREEILTGERKHTSSAYLTYVAVDTEGKPRPVPKATPRTAVEKRRFRDAGRRRSWRIRRANARHVPPR